MIGMAFVHTWQQMAGLRAVLGAFESTLYPGAAFLIACWYPRREMAVRNAFFYVSSKALSGLGNILSYAIGLLHGNANLNGWQWIFLVQGLLTIVIGFFGVWLIVDFPDKAKFLSADEQQMVNERIQRDRGDAVPDAMTTKKFLNYAIDFKPWLFGIFLCSSTLGAYSMSYFLPVILQSMGFNNAESQLLTAPPAVFVAIPAMISAHVSDRYKMRAYPIAVNSVGLIIGTCE